MTNEPLVVVLEGIGQSPHVDSYDLGSAISQSGGGGTSGELNSKTVSEEDYEGSEDILFGIGFSPTYGDLFAQVMEGTDFFIPEGMDELTGEVTVMVDTDYDNIMIDFELGIDLESGNVYMDINNS